MAENDSGRERFEPYKKLSPRETVKMNVDLVYSAAARLKATIEHDTRRLIVRYEDTKKVESLVSNLFDAGVELDFALDTLSKLIGTK